MNLEEDKQKTKRLSQLLSTIETNTAKPDKEFLNKLQEKSTAEFMTSSANDTNNSQTKTSLPVWRIPLWSKAGYLAASFLVISSLVACVALSKKVADLRDELELARRDIAATPIDDSLTINFYLKEHQDFIARQASLNSAASLPIQMQISLDDLVYYEFLDDELEFMRPGIIVRGPSSEQEIGSSESSIISNGHTLNLSEARETATFDLLALPRLHPGYMLDKIRKIQDRDAMQLLYTNGINSVSLFEQPLDGEFVLSHQDFREYAVYNNQGEGGGTILAWRDDALSYVLISGIKVSQLMEMAQSISAAK